MSDKLSKFETQDEFFEMNVVRKFATMPPDIYNSLSRSSPIVRTVVDVIRQAISEFETVEGINEPKPDK